MIIGLCGLIQSAVLFNVESVINAENHNQDTFKLTVTYDKRIMINNYSDGE